MRCIVLCVDVCWFALLRVLLRGLVLCCVSCCCIRLVCVVLRCVRLRVVVLFRVVLCCVESRVGVSCCFV